MNANDTNPDASTDDAPLREHEAWSLQLAASLDGELDAAAQRRLDDHLRGCARCRGELKLQRAVSARLAREPLALASRRLRERVRGVGEAPARPRFAPRALAQDYVRRLADTALLRRTAGLLAGGGWAVAAVLALILAWPQARHPAPADVPMVADALADYRLHAGQVMTPPASSPAQLMQAVLGWSTLPLPLRDASLISSWQTRIGGEAAVALAYRRGNHVIVQYIVSDVVFFRQPQVREAVASTGIFRADAGAQSLIARPSRHAGHLLVGAPQALAGILPQPL